MRLVTFLVSRPGNEVEARELAQGAGLLARIRLEIRAVSQTYVSTNLKRASDT
jgi:hypothetical protein